MNKPNEVGGGGGGRAERMPAVGKPFTSGAGWVLNLCWVSEGSLWNGGAALSPYTHTHNVQAAQFPEPGVTVPHLAEQDRFLQDVQGVQPSTGHIQANWVLYQQHLALFRAASSDNNMASLLCYCSLSVSSGKSGFHRKLSYGKLILPEVLQQSPSGRKAAQWAHWEEADG